jgi:hypothetical protein
MVLSERDIRQIMVKSTLTSDEVGKIRLDLDSEIVIVSKNLAQLNIKKAANTVLSHTNLNRIENVWLNFWVVQII